MSPAITRWVKALGMLALAYAIGVVMLGFSR